MSNSHSRLILGIDPGFAGALAVFSPDAKSPRDGLVGVWDMPVIEESDVCATIARGPDGKRPKTRRVVDGEAVATLLRPFAKNLSLAVLERVSAMPDDGVVSAFRFGQGVGVLQGVLAGMGIRTFRPPPAVWKASFGLSHDKSLSIALAQAMFGDAAKTLYFNLKKHDGRAEAALLASYGKRYLSADVSPFDELY